MDEIDLARLALFFVILLLTYFATWKVFMILHDVYIGLFVHGTIATLVAPSRRNAGKAGLRESLLVLDKFSYPTACR